MNSLTSSYHKGSMVGCSYIYIYMFTIYRCIQGNVAYILDFFLQSLLTITYSAIF